MKCPFCRKSIPENVRPLEHMVACQQKEAEKWNAFLNGRGSPPKAESHRAGCVCDNCYKSAAKAAAQ